MNLVTISDARAGLPELVKKASDHFEKFLITVNNQPKAVILSIDELESLQETAEILAVPGLLESIEKAEREIKKGKFSTHHQLKADLGL